MLGEIVCFDLFKFNEMVEEVLNYSKSLVRDGFFFSLIKNLLVLFIKRVEESFELFKSKALSWRDFIQEMFEIFF